MSGNLQERPAAALSANGYGENRTTIQEKVMVTTNEQAIDSAVSTSREGANQTAMITVQPAGPSTGANLGLVIRRTVAVALAGWAVVMVLGILANSREFIHNGSAGVIMIPWGMLAIAYFLWKKY
jgi:hypothetical protein